MFWFAGVFSRTNMVTLCCSANNETVQNNGCLGQSWGVAVRAAPRGGGDRRRVRHEASFTYHNIAPFFQNGANQSGLRYVFSPSCSTGKSWWWAENKSRIKVYKTGFNPVVFIRYEGKPIACFESGCSTDIRIDSNTTWGFALVTKDPHAPNPHAPRPSFKKIGSPSTVRRLSSPIFQLYDPMSFLWGGFGSQVFSSIPTR